MMTEATSVKVTREDAVALCVGLGFKTASKWDKERMLRKLRDLASMISDGGEVEVEEGTADAERLNALLTEIAEAGGEVTVVKQGAKEEVAEEPQQEKKPAKKSRAKKSVKEEPQEVEPIEEEITEEDEPEEEEDEEEKEEEMATKPKAKAKAKATSGEKKEKRGVTCFSESLKMLFKNPDLEFADLRKALEKKGIFKNASARTAMSSVRTVVAGLREAGLMKK